MPSIDIRKIDYATAEQLKEKAAKEHIYFFGHFRYIGCFSDDILVGVVAYTVAKVKGGIKATLRNDFLLKEYRGNGLYHRMQEYRMAYLRALQVNQIEINCNSVSLPMHLHWGAKVVKRFKYSTRLIYD